MSALRPMLMLPVAAMVATCAAAQQVNTRPLPHADQHHRGRDCRELPRVRDDSRHQWRGAAPDAARRGAGHETPVRQRHDRGLYSVSYDGKTRDAVHRHQCRRVGRRVQSGRSERGVQSFAFHPQFSQRGTPGYGKFYTYVDTINITPVPDFTTPGKTNARHGAARVDGEDGVGRDLRWRLAARDLPRRASVRQPQWRSDRLQPAGEGGQRRSLAFSTWASPTAATAAIRSTRAEPELAIRQDSAHRSARKEQRKRQIRHSGGNPFVKDARRHAAARSTRTAFVIRSASRGTRRPARCISPTSARTRSKRSAR